MLYNCLSLRDVVSFFSSFIPLIFFLSLHLFTSVLLLRWASLLHRIFRRAGAAGGGGPKSGWEAEELTVAGHGKCPPPKSTSQVRSLSRPSTDVPLCISNRAANCLLFHPNSRGLTQILTLTDSAKTYFETKKKVKEKQMMKKQFGFNLNAFQPALLFGLVP